MCKWPAPSAIDQPHRADDGSMTLGLLMLLDRGLQVSLVMQCSCGSFAIGQQVRISLFSLTMWQLHDAASRTVR